ncbi:hypothetical protein P4S68_17140 [Pseudoalteromonas sp. Hal099]
MISDAGALLGAINAGLGDGDVLGLNTGVYADLDAIMLTSAATLKAA